jgi:hypothetical protein
MLTVEVENQELNGVPSAVADARVRALDRRLLELDAESNLKTFNSHVVRTAWMVRSAKP